MSLFYFSVNRTFTSICFAREWNKYASKRRGLRVMCPEGEQSSTHFLQLPTNFAAPLTIASGLLRWLLSQSLFLVRLEKRNREGKLHPNSTCACGYSVISLLVICIILLVLVLTTGLLLSWPVEVHILTARPFSLVISAACYPSSEDVGCHLKAVQWGVVK